MASLNEYNHCLQSFHPWIVSFWVLTSGINCVSWRKLTEQKRSTNIQLCVIYICQFLWFINPVSRGLNLHQLQKHYHQVLRAQKTDKNILGSSLQNTRYCTFLFRSSVTSLFQSTTSLTFWTSKTHCSPPPNANIRKKKQFRAAHENASTSWQNISCHRANLSQSDECTSI